MKMKLYALLGSTGTYDTREEWTVATYTTREQAETHKNKLDEIIKDITRKINDYSLRVFTIEKKIKESGYDKKIDIQYNGVYYKIREISVYRHFDEYLESNDY